jgi:signal transduction histidine kinase
MSVKTDKDILSTVLRNLLTNAIKYSPDGGKVEIGYAADKEYTKISVTDYGVGMEETEINTILNTGVNVNSKPDVEGEQGAGLGLMLCKELLQKISGKMDIKSKKDKGSRFDITIPSNI